MRWTAANRQTEMDHCKEVDRVFEMVCCKNDQTEMDCHEEEAGRQTDRQTEMDHHEQTD